MSDKKRSVRDTFDMLEEILKEVRGQGARLDEHGRAIRTVEANMTVQLDAVRRGNEEAMLQVVELHRNYSDLAEVVTALVNNGKPVDEDVSNDTAGEEAVGEQA